MSIFKDNKGQGQDVVLIHGWGCNRREMAPIADLLAKRYHVTNIDLPGVGSSDWDPNTNSIYDVAKQIAPELPKNAIYIGWSFGGLVAMALAIAYPERVKHFIGIGTNPRFIEDDNWIGFPKPGFQAGFEIIKEKGLKSLLREDYAIEFTTVNTDPSNDLIQNLEHCAEIPQHILFKGIEIVDSTDLRKEFVHIKCPMDFIMGSADIKAPLESLKQAVALNPKMKIHTVDNAKHMPFWTHPKEFNQILETIW